MTGVSRARETQRLTRAFGAKLSGRERGPDHGPDRRVPRRHSYEVTDPRAKPHSKIGDGSVKQGLIHKEKLIETAQALRLEQWKEHPRAEVRRRRRERDELAVELEQLMAMSPADMPIGRPATARMAIAEHDEWLALADRRLRRIDIDVLKGLLSCLTNFLTGELFPTEETIAERAGVSKNSVIEAKKRLRIHGLIDWVRRTVRTGNEGEFGPQLEQTSNAYEIAPRARMAARTWQHYRKLLGAALRRLGAPRPPSPPPTAMPPPAIEGPLTPLQAAVASLGSSVDNATP